MKYIANHICALREVGAGEAIEASSAHYLKYHQYAFDIFGRYADHYSFLYLFLETGIIKYYIISALRI